MMQVSMLDIKLQKRKVAFDYDLTAKEQREKVK